MPVRASRFTVSVCAEDAADQIVLPVLEAVRAVPVPARSDRTGQHAGQLREAAAANVHGAAAVLLLPGEHLLAEWQHVRHFQRR